jgi:hypothetical protein
MNNLHYSSATKADKAEIISCLAHAWNHDTGTPYEECVLMYDNWIDFCFVEDNLSFIVRDTETKRIIGAQLNCIIDLNNRAASAGDNTGYF